MTNTLIQYQYRDGSNYKVGHEVILEGKLTQKERDDICASSQSSGNGVGELGDFIPGEVGLKDLQNDFDAGHGYWDPDQDHPFHEIEVIEDTERSPTIGMTAPEFAIRMKIMTNKWDFEYTPPFYGEMLERFHEKDSGQAFKP